MKRLAVLLVMVLAPGLLHAQPEQRPAVPVTKLTVKATTPPVPVLRYELLPSYRERIPGNAALSYGRASLLLSERRTPDAKVAAEHELKIDEMVAKPLKEIERDKLHGYLDGYRQILRELESGARHEYCDWDLERRIDADGVAALLPEIQKMRELARLLSHRCRLHCVEGKISEALQDVQFGFALAKHVGEGPTLINSLVGMAIFQIFAGKLEQIIELPGCPNLYWSLTALPRPFLNMSKPLEGEMRMLDGTLPLLRDLEKGPMTAEQVRHSLSQWAVSLQNLGVGGEAQYLRSPLLMAALVSMQYPNARQSLLQIGKTEAELDAMPAGQIALLDAVIRFKSLRDEMFIWFNLPYYEGGEGLKKAQEKASRMRTDGPGDVFGTLLFMLFPAVEKVHFASVRSERKIAILRTIEALRLHAAKGNKFPATLAEISVVPPVDPLSGLPFLYELSKDGKALLTAPPPRGQLEHQGNAMKYEITLTR